MSPPALSGSRVYCPHRRLKVEPLEDRRMLSVVTVSTEQDVIDSNDGMTSLREAIFAANTVPGSDNIVFDFGHDGPAVIELEHGELEIAEAVTITGDGPELLTIDAQEQSRIFNITAETGDFLIAGMTLTNGKTSGDGGAVRSVAAGTLTIDSSGITNSTTVGMGTSGGGLFARGELVVTKSTISGNSTVSRGGGIRGSNVTLMDTAVSRNHAFYGAGIFGGGDVSLTNSSVYENVASYMGGGISVESFSDSTVSVKSSTISGNSAERGGGLAAYWISGVTISDSTISGNSATQDGGGILVIETVVQVAHSTITGNSAGTRGGGVQTIGITFVSLSHSIAAENTDNGTGPDLRMSEWSQTSIQDSLIGDNTGTGLAEAPIGMPDANGNLIGGPINGIIDPLLGPLADNGGPTQTHALLAGSPAIDAGDPSFAAPPDFDQRGIPRVLDGNADGVARIDMGAFEVLRGDVNGDGEVNGLDVDPFVAVLLNGPPSATADMNADGNVNGLDVDSFVAEVVSDGVPVGALGAEHALNTMDVGSTSRQLHRRRPIHDSNHADDPAHLIHRRTAQHALTRQSRTGDSAREAGQRSPPGDVVHNVLREATDGWHVDVDLAMRDDTNWDRRR